MRRPIAVVFHEEKNDVLKLYALLSTPWYEISCDTFKERPYTYPCHRSHGVRRVSRISVPQLHPSYCMISLRTARNARLDLNTTPKKWLYIP
jgi:hypothetical protein